VYIVRTGWLAGWLAGWLLSLPYLSGSIVRRAEGKRERERVREEGWRSEGRRERNVWSC